MNVFDDVLDDVDDLDSDMRNLLDGVEEVIGDYEDVIDDRDRMAVAAANRNIAMLYQEEDISQFQAKQFEELTDAYLEAAGKSPYFDSLPDDKRPSEMYQHEDVEPQGFFERLGYAFLG